MRALLFALSLFVVTSPSFARYNPVADCDDALRQRAARADFCEQIREHRGPAEAARCYASLRPLPARCESSPRPLVPGQPDPR